MAPEERYFSYLLRFRREREGAPWHVDLEDAHTGQRLTFASADSAFTFLRERLGGAEPALPTRSQASGELDASGS